MALLGATPNRFGPRPLKSPGTPSWTKMNLEEDKLLWSWEHNDFFNTANLRQSNTLGLGLGVGPEWQNRPE